MVALALGRDLISTDDLARHPGRPSPTVPSESAGYYSNLSDQTIHWFLKVHHENLWPRIAQMIDLQRQAGRPFVLEGAALRPEYMARIETGVVLPLLLHCNHALLRKRMIAASHLEDADDATAAVIGKFIRRSVRDNEVSSKRRRRCRSDALMWAFEELSICWRRNSGAHGPDAPDGCSAARAPGSLLGGEWSFATEVIGVER